MDEMAASEFILSINIQWDILVDIVNKAMLLPSKAVLDLFHPWKL
jgi:hypothetical protein